MFVFKSSKYKDVCGETIHFNEPYFDKALRRSFNTAEEKARFMNERRIVQNGDLDIKVKKEVKALHEQKMETNPEYKKNNETGG